MDRYEAFGGERVPLIGHTLASLEGRLLAIDHGVCEIMQRDSNDLIGMSYTDLTHPDDRARNVDVLQRLGLCDGPATIRKRYVRPDGSVVWADVNVSRSVGGSDAGRLIGTIRAVYPDAGDGTPARLWQRASLIHALIQQRRAELGDDLFSDNAWIILLQIYLAEAEGRTVDAAMIGGRADVRATIVARWLIVLAHRDLIEPPGADDRIVQLTANGIAKVERLLAANGGI